MPLNNYTILIDIFEQIGFITVMYLVILIVLLFCKH